MLHITHEAPTCMTLFTISFDVDIGVSLNEIYGPALTRLEFRYRAFQQHRISVSRATIRLYEWKKNETNMNRFWHNILYILWALFLNSQTGF